MPRFPSFPHALVLCAALIGLSQFTPAASAVVLYSTDFSNFPAGDDRLAGHDGWEANTAGQGVQGVGDNLVAGLGKSGWLGYGWPITNLVRVYRDFDPAATPALPSVVEFTTLLGIAPSLIGGNDTFSLAVYNTSGVFLAAVKFNTSLQRFGIWTDDGILETYSGTDFFLNSLHVLTVQIDFPQNLWWGYLDGAALFQRSRFTATAAARNAGSFSLEWEIASLQNPGDNWLLFDNLNVSSYDLRIASIRREENGSLRLLCVAPSTGTYQVQISSNCTAWADLPGARLQASAPGQTLAYTNALSGPAQFVRLKQLAP